MENYSLSDIAAASGGEGFGGNSAWVLILLFAMIFGGNGFGGFGGSGAATGQDIQRAVDLNSIQQGQRDNEARTQEVGSETISAIKDAAYNNLQEIRDNGSLISAGNANIINALTGLQGNMSQCCCDVKSTVMENRYLDGQNAAAIMANSTANAQKVLDAISQGKIDSLQSQVNTLQNQITLQQAMCGVPKINPYMYGIVPSYSGCGCNNV